MFCKFCGKEIENDSCFCRHCGASLEDTKILKFNDSLKKRINQLDTGKWKEEEKHLNFLVVSKDKQSISIVDNADNIDFYDCHAIISVLRCDCRNGYGYHFNHFFDLGFFDSNLEPMSQLTIGGYAVKYVAGQDYDPRWGFLCGKDRYDNIAYIFLYPKRKTLIEWDDWKDWRS